MVLYGLKRKISQEKRGKDMIWIIALIIVIALMVIKKKINEKKEREEVEAWKYQKKINNTEAVEFLYMEN